MTKGILGITDLQISHALNDVTRITVELVAVPEYNAHHLLKEDWIDLFPNNVIVKCNHCGRWAASKTSCKQCGAPVD